MGLRQILSTVADRQFELFLGFIELLEFDQRQAEVIMRRGIRTF